MTLHVVQTALMHVGRVAMILAFYDANLCNPNIFRSGDQKER